MVPSSTDASLHRAGLPLLHQIHEIADESRFLFATAVPQLQQVLKVAAIPYQHQEIDQGLVTQRFEQLLFHPE